MCYDRAGGMRSWIGRLDQRFVVFANVYYNDAWN